MLKYKFLSLKIKPSEFSQYMWEYGFTQLHYILVLIENYNITFLDIHTIKRSSVYNYIQTVLLDVL